MHDPRAFFWTLKTIKCKVSEEELVVKTQPKTFQGQLRSELGGHNERGKYAFAVRPNSAKTGLASEDDQRDQELLLGA